MRATFTVDIEFDGRKTDAESIATALDRLMETALSTPGITDDFGGFTVGEFYVASEPGSQLERWAYYDPDQQTMLTTQTFPSYEDAVDAAPAVADVLIVKFTVCTIGDDEDPEDEEDDDG